MLSKKLSKGQLVLTVVLLALLTIGIDFEFQSFYYDGQKPAVYLVSLVSLLLLSIYIIPAMAIIQHFRKKWSIPLSYWAISLFVGLFGAGWLASYGNDFYGEFFWQKLVSKAFYKQWADALTAPLVEEVSKFIVVILLVALFKMWNKREVFLTGFTVGIGFQILEDFSYILQTSLASKHGDIMIAFERIASGLASHALYTSVFSVGLVSLLRKNREVSLAHQLLWALGPVVLHFFWNSPWVNTLTVDTFSVISILDSIILLLLFLDVFTYVNTKEEGLATKS